MADDKPTKTAKADDAPVMIGARNPVSGHALRCRADAIPDGYEPIPHSAGHGNPPEPKA